MLIKNFLFHRVSPQEDKLWPPMKPALFEEIIGFLSRNYHVCSLESIAEKNFQLKPPKKIATVLFDDGYKDNIEYAVPILHKYNCPASFYVVTDCIDKNIPTWTYIVDDLFQNSHVKSLRFEMDFVSEAFRSIDCKTSQQRLDVGGRLKPWMKTLSNHQRQEILASLEKQMSDVEVPHNLMMNWTDLSQMKSAGFNIGSHSVSHPLLAKIKNDEELAYELFESGNRIKMELGEFPAAISYPVGSFDKRVMDQSRKAGYKFGLAVEQRFFDSERDDVFAIPRVELYNESMIKTITRISGLFGWVKRRMK